MPANQIITFILGSAVVIFGAYFVTYLVARGSHKVYKGRAIQVLDRFSLSKDKSLMLVAVYDKLYLVAYAAGSVTLLDSIEPETAARFAAVQQHGPESGVTGGSLAASLQKLRSRLSADDGEAPEHQPIPFEAYLSAEQEDSPDRLDMVYSMMQNRKEKEGRRGSFEDLLK